MAAFDSESRLALIDLLERSQRQDGDLAPEQAAVRRALLERRVFELESAVMDACAEWGEVHGSPINVSGRRGPQIYIHGKRINESAREKRKGNEIGTVAAGKLLNHLLACAAETWWASTNSRQKPNTSGASQLPANLYGEFIMLAVRPFFLHLEPEIGRITERGKPLLASDWPSIKRRLEQALKVRRQQLLRPR